METIKSWFTPANREKIYTAIAALAPILVTAGVITNDQVQPYLVIVAALLQAFGGILALSNLKPTEAARWFGTVGRGIIYSAALAVAGAIVVLGFVTQDFANTALTYTSFGLTALAAILAVVTPKEVSFSPDEIPVAADAIVVNDAIVSPVEGTVTQPAIEPAPVAPAPVEPVAEPVNTVPVETAPVETEPVDVVLEDSDVPVEVIPPELQGEKEPEVVIEPEEAEVVDSAELPPVAPDTDGRGDWH